jgi:hypothetical protein
MVRFHETWVSSILLRSDLQVMINLHDRVRDLEKECTESRVERNQEHVII